MKKWIYIVLFSFTLTGCDKEDAPRCLQTTGDIIRQEVPVETFEELVVFGHIKLFIEQGGEQKVIVEAGRNLIDDVSVTVENGRLSLRHNNSCNIFREYNTTTVYVTVPNLRWLQNASNNTIESVGTLFFPAIQLKSVNPQKESGIYTNGDFKLDLVSDHITITGDNFSNFFLSGEVDLLDINIVNGDGRVEAAGLEARVIQIMHRGTNKLIVNPQEELKGEIRSTGDVISVNRPPVVDVHSFYSGSLYFQ